MFCGGVQMDLSKCEPDKAKMKKKKSTPWVTVDKGENPLFS